MPPVGKGKRVQLHKELDAFLDASNTDQASIDALSKYLQSRADEYGTIVEKLLPADEIEERLRIARKIQAEIWDGIDDEKLKDLTRLTVLQLAIIMTIPLEYLRQNVSDSLPFDAIRRLVHLCTLNVPIFDHSCRRTFIDYVIIQFFVHQDILRPRIIIPLRLAIPERRQSQREK